MVSWRSPRCRKPQSRAAVLSAAGLLACLFYFAACSRLHFSLDNSNLNSDRRLLFIDALVPEGDRDSGSIRCLGLLEILIGAGYEISFGATLGSRSVVYVDNLRQLGVQLLPVAKPATWPLQLRGRCAFGTIVIARRSVYQSMQGRLAQGCPQARLIYDTVDLHFLREARNAMSSENRRQNASGWDFGSLSPDGIVEWMEGPTPAAAAARRARDAELALVLHSQLTLVVSPVEARLIGRYLPRARVAVVSNIIPEHSLDGDGTGSSLQQAPAPAPCEARSGALFVGNLEHLPNRQAIQALVRDILPLVARQLPAEELAAFRLHIVGANAAPPALLQLMQQQGERVVFHGQLSDPELLDLYDRVRVALAPLLSGAGVKGKVNQAMSMGVPVVATPVAAEGMYAQDGKAMLVGSTPEAFAQSVVRLHSDCQLWRRLATSGCSSVREHFSVELARQQLLKAMHDIGTGNSPPARSAGL